LKTEFDFDKASIRPEYLEHLKKIAEFMAEYPETVTTIEGHTCSIGTESYNLALSARRANSVKERLIGLGVDPQRLNIAAYGETKPIADNSTSVGRQQNRRAVAVITTTIQEYIDQQK
jgi:OOP family OmpA-OmpF porin